MFKCQLIVLSAMLVVATARPGYVPVVENNIDHYVCSIHFLDGEPTTINPIPQLELGYKKKVVKGRRPLRKVAIPETIPLEEKQNTSRDVEEIENQMQNVQLHLDEEFDVQDGTVSRSCQTEQPATTRDNSTQYEDYTVGDYTYARPKLQPFTRDFGVQVNFPDYSAKSMSENDSRFYTGLDLHVFWRLVEVLSAYRATPFRLPTMEQILLVFMRLRLGLLFADLGRRFHISTSLASNIFNTWIPIMADALTEHNVIAWLSRETIQNSMPHTFKELYPHTSCIIDCTEIYIQRPTRLMARAQTYSSYKSHNTAKFLVAIAPHDHVMYVSNCYGGRASDKFIISNSDFLKFILPGDEVMADRGFTIESELAMLRARLNIPAFTRGRMQLPEEEVTRSRRIASVRIHVERAIARIKHFRLLKFTLHVKNISSSLDNIVVTCAALTNLMSPLIKNNEDEEEIC